MPARASSRLTAFVLGPAGGSPATEVLLALAAEGGVDVVEGGADWSAHEAEREHFFANGQGGFRVVCPACEAQATSRFWKALEAWRQGGARTFKCTCGVSSDLADLQFFPAAGFAARWLRGAKAASLDLTPAAQARLDALWPGFRVVGSRG